MFCSNGVFNRQTLRTWISEHLLKKILRVPSICGVVMWCVISHIRATGHSFWEWYRHCENRPIHVCPKSISSFPRVKKKFVFDKMMQMHTILIYEHYIWIKHSPINGLRSIDDCLGHCALPTTQDFRYFYGIVLSQTYKSFTFAVLESLKSKTNVKQTNRI